MVHVLHAGNIAGRGWGHSLAMSLTGRISYPTMYVHRFVIHTNPYRHWARRGKIFGTWLSLVCVENVDASGLIPLGDTHHREQEGTLHFLPYAVIFIMEIQSPWGMSVLLCCVVLNVGLCSVDGANPIRAGGGVADPHVHVWNDDMRIYMYATHDYVSDSAVHFQIIGTALFVRRSPNRTIESGSHCSCSQAQNSSGFRMDNWWIWSTDDLLSCEW